jgi:radical SAM protein with 4Fe4S-binding SPASM domain
MVEARVLMLGGTDCFSPHVPMALQVEFTSRCNLRCRMCPLTTKASSSSAAPGPMFDAVFDEVLAVARRCRWVIVAGYGEALTNPQCLPMLRALDAEGIDMSIATNGLALSPAVARSLSQIRHLSMINVSIDSPDPDVYRAVRRGNVERALEGLRHLMAEIDRPERVMVSSIAMLETLESLVDFPPLLAEIGVRRFAVQAIVDYNEYCVDQRLLDHPEMAARFDAIEVSCAAHGIRLDFSVPDRSVADLADPDVARQRYYGFDAWDEGVTRQCLVPWEIPFVDKNGVVFACCNAASANERPLGRIGDQTFDEIWTGVEFRRFRTDIVDGRTTPDVCRRCTIVPLGTHLFKTWAATLISAAAVPAGRDTAVTVVLRNSGSHTWTRADCIRVGVARPRDSPSRLATSNWLSGNRAATFVETEVPPGEVATFEFRVSPPPGTTTEEFAVVADGSCWFPGTHFAVTVRGRRRAARAIKREIAGLRRHWGRGNTVPWAGPRPS